MVGREELKWRQLAHHQLMSQTKDLILVRTVQLKPMIKAQISGRMVSSGISDVAFALWENPSEEVYDDYDN